MEGVKGSHIKIIQKRLEIGIGYKVANADVHTVMVKVKALGAVWLERERGEEREMR